MLALWCEVGRPMTDHPTKRGSYRIYVDGIFGGIQHDPRTRPNGADALTFTQARKALARRFMDRADEYREAAKWARSLTLADVESPDE